VKTRRLLGQRAYIYIYVYIIIDIDWNHRKIEVGTIRSANFWYNMIIIYNYIYICISCCHFAIAARLALGSCYMQFTYGNLAVQQMYPHSCGALIPGAPMACDQPLCAYGGPAKT
jgi:hypothetical protein